MPKQFPRVIDAINKLGHARQTMAFNVKRDIFKIIAVRDSRRVRYFLIAMYSQKGTFCGYF